MTATRRSTVCAGLLALVLPLPALAAVTATSQARSGEGLTPVARVDLEDPNLGDMAFWGDTLVVAHGMTEPTSGFSVLDIRDPEDPDVLSTQHCEGTTHDISVWGDLVVQSVDSGEGGGQPDCEATGDSSWGGLRVFSIADRADPVQVAAVSTCNGSHTHTLVPDLAHRDGAGRARPRLLAYVSTAQCPAEPGSTTLPGMQVVEIPLHDPASSEPAAEVRLPLAQPQACHDLTYFAPRRLGLAACSLSGSVLFDMSDPAAPVPLATLATPPDRATAAVNGNHSAAFSPDGTVLAIGEESGGGFANACLDSSDGRGGIRFYDVRDPRRPVLRSTYEIPRPALAISCTAHLFSPVHTTDGRRLFVSAWLGGGVTVVDVTDPGRPAEVAHYAPDGTYAFAAYEYNGYVYVTNTQEQFVVIAPQGRSRGLDVLRVDGVRTRSLSRLVPQTQLPG